MSKNEYVALDIQNRLIVAFSKLTSFPLVAIDQNWKEMELGMPSGEFFCSPHVLSSVAKIEASAQIIESFHL